MQIEQSDERDSSWESHTPLFRIYLFNKSDIRDSSWSVVTYDMKDADVLEAVRWAQEQAGEDGMFSIALVSDLSERQEQYSRGLVWLVGMDANDFPSNSGEQQIQHRMRARRGKRVVLDE